MIGRLPADMHVECITGIEALQERVPIWRALQQRSAIGEWFSGPDWVVPWLSHFGAQWTPAVHFVHHQGSLVGVVPFCTRRQRPLGSAILELPHNSHTRRVGWLANDSSTDVLGAVLAFVRSSRPYGALRFSHLERDGSLAQQLELAAVSAGLRHHHVEESRSAVITLADGWEAYAASRDGRFLRSLRRHLRRLSEETEWSVVHHSGVDGFEERWNQVLDIERQSWKHAAGSSIPAERGAELFYRQIAQQFAQGHRLHLWLLLQHGKPVAHALAVEDRSVMYLLKNSFAEHVRSHSPGISLVWKALEWAALTGCQTFDMLGDDEGWKLPLATHLPAYASWTLYPAHHLRAQLDRLEHQTLRPAYRTLRDRARNISGGGSRLSN